jgi:outer membrane protein
MTMKTVNWKVIGIAALGVGALQALPAAAEPASDGAQSRHEVSFYAGRLNGDDIDNASVVGSTPKLDDDTVYGIRYALRLSKAWGLEFSVGHSSTAVTNLGGPDIDLDLNLLDADAVRHFGRGGRWDPYVAFGLGYAWANLDRPFAGIVDGRAVTIDDDNGYTVNAGIGAHYAVSKRINVSFEARYRYIDRVFKPADDSLGTFEPTVAVGLRF